MIPIEHDPAPATQPEAGIPFLAHRRPVCWRWPVRVVPAPRGTPAVSAPFARPRNLDPMTSICPRVIALSLFLLPAGLLGSSPAPAADPPTVSAETPAEAARRHEVVAGRRKGVVVICHRGASEHACENTLESFRATFELGGDGN